MRYRVTLANRLHSAIIFMAVLIITVSSIAVMNWKRLNNQIETILEINMPTMQASFQLELQTTSLLTALNKLQRNLDPLEHNQLAGQITNHLHTIKNVIERKANLPQQPVIATQYKQLAEQISLYLEVLQRRNVNNFYLMQLRDTLLARHQVLISNLRTLSTHIERQTHSPTSFQGEDHHIHVIKSLALIQSITLIQSQLNQKIVDTIDQRYHRDLDAAIYTISQQYQQLMDELSILSELVSTRTYEQEAKQLGLLIKQGGDLSKILISNKQLSEAINQRSQLVHKEINRQELLIQQILIEQQKTAIKTNQATNNLLSISTLILLGTVVFTIFLTVLLCVYLIGRGIVHRLNLLSQDLKTVLNDEEQQDIRVSGDDEIGRLGDNLRHFRKQMQQLKQTNALNLLDNTPASIVTCDLDGIIETVNSSARSLFKTPITPTKDAVWFLFKPNMHARLQSLFHINGPLYSNGACNLTLKHISVHQDEIYLRLDFRRFQQGKQDKVIITMTDISEQENAARWLESMVREKTYSLTNRNRQLKAEVEDRKRVEADLRATQDDLIQAAKMAVVGQTMTSLAHELNQPLSAISTHIYATKMATDVNNFTRLPESLDTISSLTSRMGRMISNLKNFAKKQTADTPFEQVNVWHAVDSAQQIIASRAKQHKIAVVNELPESLHIHSAQLQLEQVLVNLLVNSCDAVSEHSNDRAIHISLLSQQPKQILLAVSDTGCGFNEEIIDKLFTPFTTTKDVGLGLGLSICRSILHRLNGEIYLASTLDRGALVVIELNQDDINKRD